MAGRVGRFVVGWFVHSAVSQSVPPVSRYLGDNSISTLVVDWMASSIVKSATWLGWSVSLGPRSTCQLSAVLLTCHCP